MRRLSVAIGGSVLIYATALLVCRVTGSGILSSGPLDSLFNILFVPGLYLADFFGIRSELLTVTLCWLVYAPILGVLVDVGVTFVHRRRSATHV
jgi:hypothetical protein